MNRLLHFIRQRWEEILILGVAVPLFLATLSTANLTLIGATGAGLLIVVAISFELVERLQRRRRQRHLGENLAFRIRRRAIIFTVGNQTTTLAFALENQNPVLIGFLCSTASLPIAQRLLNERGLPPERCKQELVDPWDIRDTRIKTNAILEWFAEQGIDPRDIVFDVTGGTTPMSVAAFSVAEERRIDSQYIRSHYEENKPIPGTQEAILIHHFGELLLLPAPGLQVLKPTDALPD